MMMQQLRIDLARRVFWSGVTGGDRDFCNKHENRAAGH
jgi:hypothetical protein